MRIAYHPVDPGEYGEFFGRTLGVASGDKNARRWILAMHAMHGLAHVVVGESSDSASI